VSSQNRHTTSHNTHQNVLASSEPEGDADVEDEDELSEGDNDLIGLNSASLQKKILSEVKSFVFLFICIVEAKYIVIQRPQWKNHPVKRAAAHQDPADLFANDKDLFANDKDLITNDEDLIANDEDLNANDEDHANDEDLNVNDEDLNVEMLPRCGS
jgi:hypothetical protein